MRMVHHTSHIALYAIFFHKLNLFKLLNDDYSFGTVRKSFYSKEFPERDNQMVSMKNESNFFFRMTDTRLITMVTPLHFCFFFAHLFAVPWKNHFIEFYLNCCCCLHLCFFSHIFRMLFSCLDTASHFYLCDFFSLPSQLYYFTKV